MKTLALLSIMFALPLAAQTPEPAAAPIQAKPELTINQLKLQVATLSMTNAQLAAHVEGLQKELESTRTQLNQLQSNALVTELCSAAGIAPKECSLNAQDGTVTKTVPPAPPKPAEETKPAAPPKQ